MSKYQNKVCAEFTNGSWAFVDMANPNNRVKFDQALLDATFVGRSRAEGFVKSVHGIDMEIAQHLDSQTKIALGVTATHRLGRGPTLKRVRLCEGGVIEQVGYV